MGTEIVIVDDDPLVGNLSADILADAGYSARLVIDSRQALAIVKEQKPRLVLLDVLMPGVDGLTLLKQIKADPETSAIKVAVLSAKAFKSDVDRAQRYGADLFIRKPYDVESFPKKVFELIGAPAAKSAGPTAAAKSVMRLRVFGRREADSSPSLMLEACDRLFILDAGKGVALLGESALSEGKHKEAWLLLSNFQPDHLSGFGRLPLLREEGWTLHILAPHDPDKGVAVRLGEAVSASGDARPMKAKVKIHEVREENYELAAGLRLHPFYANHPGSSMGYLLDLSGRKVVYSPNAELYGETVSSQQDYDEKTGRICRGADLLVHDAHWTDEDYLKHKDEGHSSVSSAAIFAAEHEMHRLLLIDADAAYTEPMLADMERKAREVLESHGAQIPCDMVRDGLNIEI
ncbi:MAG: response regulator [Elusimicrobiota bacterium]|jgi:CheY-like chemotaxis protein